MSAGKTRFLLVLLLGVLIAVTAFAAGCSLSGSSPNASDSSSPPASAAERALAILGHAPTGLAKTVLDRGTVIVATDADYAPQSSIDKDTGELVGFDIDVARRMGEILGLTVEFRTVPWESVIPGLRAGKSDVSIGSMAITEEREKTVDFTEPYYYSSGQVFVRKGGTQIAGGDDLAGKAVGVVAATTYYDWLKANTTADVKTYTAAADAFSDLRNGNLDFVMIAGSTGQQAITEGEPLEFSGPPMFYEDLSFATKRGEADWLAILDYSVQQMHKGGALSTISKKWFDGTDLTVKE